MQSYAAKTPTPKNERMFREASCLQENPWSKAVTEEGFFRLVSPMDFDLIIFLLMVDPQRSEPSNLIGIKWHIIWEPSEWTTQPRQQPANQEINQEVNSLQHKMTRSSTQLLMEYISVVWLMEKCEKVWIKPKSYPCSASVRQNIPSI